MRRFTALCPDRIDEKDPIEGLLPEERDAWLEREWAAQLERFAEVHALRHREERGELSAEEVLAEIRRLYGDEEGA